MKNNEFYKRIIRWNLIMPFIEQNYSRRRNYFSASHFLIGFSKCDRLHGHDYSVKLRIRYHSEIQDDFFDFRTVNLWLDQITGELNQKILLPENNHLIKIKQIRNGENLLILVQGKRYSFPKKDVMILEGVEQTTSEEIARYIHNHLTGKIKETGKNEVVFDLTIILSETIGNEVSYTSEEL